MFNRLIEVCRRPEPFEYYTVPDLWTDEYISRKMLELHIDPQAELASRTKAFIDRSADWIVSRAGVGEGTRVCDFGCGPGLYTSRFAERGAAVTGIDFSPRSIGYARAEAKKKNLQIDYVLQNYLEYSSDKKFDLITMIYVDFCVLSPQQRNEMFRKFRDHLDTNGLLILDALSLNHFMATNETLNYEYSAGNGFWSPEPYFAFTNVFKYEREKLILAKHTIIEADRTREIYNWLQCFSLDSLKQEFLENGFRIIEHCSDVAGTRYNPDSKEIAVVAEKL